MLAGAPDPLRILPFYLRLRPPCVFGRVLLVNSQRQSGKSANESAKVCFRSLLTADIGKNRTEGRSVYRAALIYFWVILALKLTLSKRAKWDFSQRFRALRRECRVARSPYTASRFIIVDGQDPRQDELKALVKFVVI